jgi:hypothetical protein
VAKPEREKNRIRTASKVEAYLHYTTSQPVQYLALYCTMKSRSTFDGVPYSGINSKVTLNARSSRFHVSTTHPNSELGYSVIYDSLFENFGGDAFKRHAVRYLGECIP